MKTEDQWNAIKQHDLRCYANPRGVLQNVRKKVLVAGLMAWDKEHGNAEANKMDREGERLVAEKNRDEAAEEAAGKAVKPGSTSKPVTDKRKRPSESTTGPSKIQKTKGMGSSSGTLSGKTIDTPKQTGQSKPGADKKYKTRSTRSSRPGKGTSSTTSTMKGTSAETPDTPPPHSEPPSPTEPTKDPKTPIGPKLTTKSPPGSPGSSSSSSSSSDDEPEDQGPNADPGRYTDEADAEKYRADHHVFEEVYSETEEEEENVPMNALGGPEREKRRKKQRQRNGEPEPEAWDGSSNYLKERKWYKEGMNLD
ncbi:hypothetical protein P153DRAFT_356104 [Dothidotthia symphoricarpi CBS 119687]|uniref:Uncharacterized protein n=1 Tax=Dothidotthia symphoricarpi CBS 119687 TaxID=1392245 RepID=A0A6A6AHD0_9PLEO|nr:uncharacterized protein P153DRAFT_356104 [Dothidotthia symphoricarpi CBS 119687]KAF2130314.1 hypothetical protein P153DRAFT_356104 [Dothidotthia symphoricarpi CBS 119687]